MTGVRGCGWYRAGGGGVGRASLSVCAWAQVMLRGKEKRDGTTTRMLGRDARLHMRCVGGLEAHAFIPRT